MSESRKGIACLGLWVSPVGCGPLERYLLPSRRRLSECRATIHAVLFRASCEKRRLEGRMVQPSCDEARCSLLLVMKREVRRCYQIKQTDGEGDPIRLSS